MYDTAMRGQCDSWPRSVYDGEPDESDSVVLVIDLNFSYRYY